MIWHPSMKKMSRYQDGILRDGASRRLEAHLAKCTRCRKKVDVLQAAARACRIPTGRLDEMVGQVGNLPISKPCWNTNTPILGEIQSVAGTVLIHRNADGPGIEAFPGCAVREGEHLETAAGGSAVIRWENGMSSTVTEATDDLMLAGTGEKIPSRKRAATRIFGLRPKFAMAAAIGTVAILAGAMLLDLPMRGRRKLRDPFAYHYDPTNGTVSKGNVYRVYEDYPVGIEGAVPRTSGGGALAPVITCIPDIIISDTEAERTQDRNFFIFSDPVNLSDITGDGVALSVLPGTVPKAALGPATAVTATTDTVPQKRLVIYTAQFSLLVSSVDDAMKELIAKVEQWKGHVQTSDLRRVTFRVPAANFDRAVAEIAQLGIVTNKQVQAQDVTRQFTDLRLRLEVAEASRKRLMDLLEKADKTEDLLKIENEIRRLTEEIERMKGEVRVLGDQVAYSTITVDLSAKTADAKPARRRVGASYFDWINQIGAEHVLRTF